MPRQRASIASAFRERKLPMEEKKELLDQDERVVEIELERLRGFVNHGEVLYGSSENAGCKEFKESGWGQADHSCDSSSDT